MTRPTVLDMDLVVVPREAAQAMLNEVTADDQHEPFSDKTMSGVFNSMLSASPYPTAWDDVRKYVEGLEARLVAVAGPCSLGVGCEQYGVCYADAHGKPEECGKPSFECEALKDARRIADHDKKLWLAAESRIAELEKEKHAALPMIAELEKRLADAERVIEPFARAVKYSEALNRHQPDEPKSRPHDFLISDEIRAARAYMEGK